MLQEKAAIQDVGHELLARYGKLLASMSTLSLTGFAFSSLVLWWSWTIIYRLYFHPLAKYPGPFFFKISILPSLYLAWKGTRHLVFDELHKKYGEAVRTEPNFLSLITPNAIRDMYGPQTKFQKAMYYTRGPIEKQVLVNIASTTDKKVHARKRRIISHAMSEAALRSYEPTIIEKIELFCKQIQNPDTFGGPYKNMSRWFSYLTYDIMGTLTFSQSYDMLTKDDVHYIQPLIDSYQHSQVILGTEPKIEQWGLAPLLFLKIMDQNRRFRKYVDDQASHRIEMEKSGQSSPDIFKLLLDHKDKDTGESMQFKELSDEAVVLILAASDTTGTALSGLFFYLARYPECYAKLKQEIRSAFSSVDEIRHGPALAGCKYLKASIEEALRMSPGVPGYLTREAPTGGYIDEHYIPPRVQVGIPTWTMHRRPDLYPEPLIFKPERWIDVSDEEMTRLRSGHFPFSTGQRGCIGKNMAYNSIYLTVARVAFLFEIESRDPLPLEFHVKDHFAAGEKEGPFLKFTPAVNAE